jgi:hypothetical protein
MAGIRTACPACGRPIDIPVASSSTNDSLFRDDFDDALSQAAAASAYVPSATLIRTPASYARPSEPLDVLRNILRRISLGISSFTIAIMSGLVYVSLVVAFADTTHEEYRRNESQAAAVGVILLLMLCACLTGAVLGTTAIKQEARDSVFAYLGVTFNVLIILTCVSCGVLNILLNNV